MNKFTAAFLVVLFGLLWYMGVPELQSADNFIACESVDTSSTNITDSTFVEIVASSKGPSGFDINNQTATAIYVCHSAIGTDCANGTSQYLDADQAWSIPVNVPAGPKVWAQSASGTISSGVVSGCMFRNKK